jgi:hypothetical protein
MNCTSNTAVQFARKCAVLIVLALANSCTIGKLDLGQNRRPDRTVSGGTPTRPVACPNVPRTPTKLFATNADEWASVKSIAVDATHVYLASDEAPAANLDGVKVRESSPRDFERRTISRIPVAGGQREIVDARSTGLDTMLLLDANNIYWTEGNALRIRPKDLTNRRSLMLDSGNFRKYGATDNAGKLYLVSLASESPYQFWELKPGGGSLLLKFRSYDSMRGLAADSSGVYWTSRIGVYSMGATATQPTRVDDETWPYWGALALDADHVYAARDNSRGTIVKLSKVGAAATTLEYLRQFRRFDDDDPLDPESLLPLISKAASLTQLVVRESRLYAKFDDFGFSTTTGLKAESWIARMDTDGQNAQVIAHGDDISNVVVDDCRSYWVQAENTEHLVYDMAK